MVTLKQIAEKTGFSVSTVSIVLGNRSKERKIPEQTQQVIQQAARELGYRPSMAARQLRAGKMEQSLQIALFWAQDFRAPMMVRFLNGLRREIDQCGQKIHLTVIPYQTGFLSAEEMLLSKSSCHGAIICNASAKDLDFLNSADIQVPVVLYNRVSSRYDTVRMDNNQIGQLGARILRECGCSRVQLITSSALFPGVEQRNESFLVTSREKGMEPLPLIFCESSRKGGYEAITGLRGKQLPDGIFCGSDSIAQGVLRGLYECGISCPNDVKVLAIGNGIPEEAVYTVPSLSVISLPMEEMAAECLTLLTGHLTEAKTDIRSREIPVQALLRESTATVAISIES
ncbi:MAG: LacI family transcriptional regulator [Lachnospiraceae bacterium]|nr:LacI family transcriptional regulator [Lachnospiraceae bacterium]